MGKASCALSLLAMSAGCVPLDSGEAISSAALGSEVGLIEEGIEIDREAASAELKGAASREGAAILPLGISVVTDIHLVASNQSLPPPGPTGYVRIGYWDVDAGGSLGTFGSTGSYMMAMYARFENTDTTPNCVEGVYLHASNSSWVPENIWPDWVRRGYWDVDKGGASGGNGTSGSYMMGLYTRSGSVANNACLIDAVLVASNSSVGNCVGGYDCAGWWDVDRGGGVGTYGTSGSYMMAFSTLSQ